MESLAEAETARVASLRERADPDCPLCRGRGQTSGYITPGKYAAYDCSRCFPQPRVGDVFVSARSKTGRRWRVARELPCELWLLVPLGDDVSTGGPQEDGKWHGGVRAIRRGTEELSDRKRWRRVPRA